MQNKERLDELATVMVASSLRAKDNLEDAWFDYRALHPVQATSVFMSAYQDAHSYVMSKRVDMTEGAKNTGIRRLSLQDQKQAMRTALWTARQHADTMSCPYDFFCLSILMRADKLNYARLPQPSQLYQEHFLEHALEDWASSLSNAPRMASSPMYQAANYAGLPCQDDYQRFLVSQVRARQQPQFLLATFLRSGHLLPRVALECFDRSLVKIAANSVV